MTELAKLTWYMNKNKGGKILKLIYFLTKTVYWTPMVLKVWEWQRPSSQDSKLQKLKTI